MVKRIILSLSLLALNCIVFATPKEVNLVSNRGEINNGCGPHSGIPIVSSDGDDVNITCDTLINNVDIVIRDQWGNVMHQSIQTIGPNETTLYVPSTDGDSEKTTIDLYYDRKHLSGYFDE